jgi:hypothetical protein
LFTAIGEPGK